MKYRIPHGFSVTLFTKATRSKEAGHSKYSKHPF